MDGGQNTAFWNLRNTSLFPVWNCVTTLQDTPRNKEKNVIIVHYHFSDNQSAVLSLKSNLMCGKKCCLIHTWSVCSEHWNLVLPLHVPSSSLFMSNWFHNGSRIISLSGKKLYSSNLPAHPSHLFLPFLLFLRLDCWDKFTTLMEDRKHRPQVVEAPKETSPHSLSLSLFLLLSAAATAGELINVAQRLLDRSFS